MFGPAPSGVWTSHLAPRDFGPLVVGVHYCVVLPFDDYDRVRHEAGESWTYLGYAYLPYDDGLSLFVSLDGEQEWHIALQWRGEEQAHIINGLRKYVRAIPGQGALARLFGR